MPVSSRAPDGRKFFARIDAFHCECPHCGTLIVAMKQHAMKPQQLKVSRHRQTQFNPIRSVLYCPNQDCKRAFGVGLLLWTLGRGKPKATIPADHHPTRQQMAELASYNVGIWATEKKWQGDALNCAVLEECTCPVEEQGFAQDCPTHGWKARTPTEEPE
jgi:hypothetical protein